MFCVNCGNQVSEGSNFCTGCGSRRVNAPTSNIETRRVLPPVAGPPVGSAGQIIATPATAGDRTVRCSWCGAVVDASQAACSECGATLNLSSVTTRAGWSKLPGRKDMAKLHIGNSICQIEGKYVPVADLKLAPEDTIYFTHNVLLWKDPQVKITAMSMKGMWKRLLGGLPLVMTQAQGPGHIAFSQDSPGELIALPLQPDQAIDVREHMFLAATGNVAYDWIQTNIWFQSRTDNQTGTHYPIGRMMDRFSTAGVPGLLLLHAAGNVFVRRLEAGQTILIKPTALVFKDPSVQMDLYYERPHVALGSWASSNTGYLWLCLSGPGRVAIQSVFEPVEGEQDFAGPNRYYSAPGNAGGSWSLLGEMLGSLLE